MTLAEVLKLLGPKARIDTDPKTGRKLEYVRVNVAGVEREGFLGTDAGTDHVSAVHFAIMDRSGESSFDVLKLNLIRTYGNPSVEHMLTAGPVCMWAFPSGNILLLGFNAHGAFKGGASLAFMKTTVPLPPLE